MKNKNFAYIGIGLLAIFMIAFSLNTVFASSTDFDEDGLSNIEEENIYYTNPLDWDTDGDSCSDGDEVLVHLTDPLDPLDHIDCCGGGPGY